MKTKSTWNYRVVTKLSGDAELQGDSTQLFSIAEVYYTNGRPDSYVKCKRFLQDLEDVKSLKWVNKKIKKAFKRPILDLDNWPHKFKS